MTLNWAGKSSILIWLLSSLFFAFAFHRIVYLDFQRELILLIQSPVAVNPGEDGLNVPFVLDADQRKESRRITIGIRNKSAETRTISAFVNDSALGTINIPPSQSHKLQVRLSVDREIFDRRNRLKLKANGDGWTLERCEIANYYGSSKGILDYIITDKKSLFPVTPSYSLTIAFLLLLIAGSFLMVHTSNSSRTDVSGHGFSERILRLTEKTSRILHLLIFFVFLALIIQPLATDSRLFLSWWTFLLLVFLASLPLFGALYKIVWRVPEQTSLQNSVTGTAACLVVFLFFYSAMVHARYQYGDYSGFLQLSQRWSKQNPFLNERPELKSTLKIYDQGYDGQFMYFIAFDPLLQKFPDDLLRYRKWIDNPPYRYGRIGYPLMTAIAASGKPERFASTMIHLIVVSNLIAAFFLVRIALFYKRSPFWVLLYPLIPAFLVSLNVGLPESLAAAFLLGGIFFYLREKFLTSALFFACALLVRETAGIAVLVLAVFEFFRQKNRRGALILACSLLPLLTWRGFLAWRMFPDYGLQAVPIWGGEVRLPFAGLIELWSKAGPEYTGGSTGQLILYPALLIAAFILSVVYLRKNKNVPGFLLAGYALLATSFSFLKVWCYIPNGERVTFEVFLFVLVSFLAVSRTQDKLYFCSVIAFFAMVLFYDLFFLSVKFAYWF